MVFSRRRVAVAALAAASAACAPEFNEDLGLVTVPRVLAVKSEPAEASPGSAIELHALLAVPDASQHAPSLTWSACLAPKPPTENNAVASACLDDAALLDWGRGASIQAEIPLEACSLFGPDTPPGDFRPRDPDVTGGYYQPLRVDVAGQAPLFHRQRLLCNLGQAPADIARAFSSSYAANRNPTLASVTMRVSGRALDPRRIPSRATVELGARFGEDDAETYAYFDREAQALSAKREALRVIWYVSGGVLEHAVTGPGESDSSLDTTNEWTAPESGALKLWVIVRDSRGGVDFRTFDLRVVE